VASDWFVAFVASGAWESYATLCNALQKKPMQLYTNVPGLFNGFFTASHGLLPAYFYDITTKINTCIVIFALPYLSIYSVQKVIKHSSTGLVWFKDHTSNRRKTKKVCMLSTRVPIPYTTVQTSRKWPVPDKTGWRTRLAA